MTKGKCLTSLKMASNAVGRIVAPPLFGLIYGHLGHDAPWYWGAVMIGLVVLVALQTVRIHNERGAIPKSAN